MSRKKTSAKPKTGNTQKQQTKEKDSILLGEPTTVEQIYKQETGKEPIEVKVVYKKAHAKTEEKQEEKIKTFLLLAKKDGLKIERYFKGTLKQACAKRIEGELPIIKEVLESEITPFVPFIN